MSEATTYEAPRRVLLVTGEGIEVDSLREEFAESHRGGERFVGISSFPAHGSEVERLAEQAEVALGAARGENSAARVVVYGFAEAGAAAANRARRRASHAEAQDDGRRERTRVRRRGRGGSAPGGQNAGVRFACGRKASPRDARRLGRGADGAD